MEETNLKQANKTIKVLFPCVHGQSPGQLVTINCFSAPELKSSIKVVTGVDEEVARRIVGAARYGETDSRAGAGVIALFSSPLFSGESYGLALAVADKLARYNPARNWSSIYATGRILSDSCGDVDAVGGFDAKLNLLAEKAKPGSLFLYPQNNIPAKDISRDQLLSLAAKGVECISVANLKELDDKVWVVSREHMKVPGILLNSFSNSSTFVKKWRIHFSFALLAISCFFGYLLFFNSFENRTAERDIHHLKNSINSPAIPVISHQVNKQQEGITKTENIQSPRREHTVSHKPEDAPTSSPVMESVQVDPDAY